MDRPEWRVGVRRGVGGAIRPPHPGSLLSGVEGFRGRRAARRRGVVPAHLRCTSSRAPAAALRCGRLPRRRFGQRRRGRAARGRPHAVHRRHHSGGAATRQHAGRARRGPHRRPHDPPRQAVLEVAAGGDLLHTYDRHLADRLARAAAHAPRRGHPLAAKPGRGQVEIRRGRRRADRAHREIGRGRRRALVRPARDGRDAVRPRRLMAPGVANSVRPRVHNGRRSRGDLFRVSNSRDA